MSAVSHNFEHVDLQYPQGGNKAEDEAGYFSDQVAPTLLAGLLVGQAPQKQLLLVAVIRVYTTCAKYHHVQVVQVKKKVTKALSITNIDHRMTKRLTSDSLGDVSWIQKATFTAVQKECATPPHVQVCHST